MNWGIVLAGLADINRPADKISGNMTFAMCIYSALFMRFAWMVFMIVTLYAENDS